MPLIGQAPQPSKICHYRTDYKNQQAGKWYFPAVTGCFAAFAVNLCVFMSIFGLFLVYFSLFMIL